MSKKLSRARLNVVAAFSLQALSRKINRNMRCGQNF